MWVGRLMTEVQSLSWDGMEGSKAVVPGCEKNNKTTNWRLGLPAHVGVTLTAAIQISTQFWDTNFIIPHLLYCYNSLNSPLTQVFMLLCFYIKTKLYDIITWVLFNFSLFIHSTPSMDTEIINVQYILPFTVDNIKFQLHV
jgi:hypothetical protein